MLTKMTLVASGRAFLSSNLGVFAPGARSELEEEGFEDGLVGVLFAVGLVGGGVLTCFLFPELSLVLPLLDGPCCRGALHVHVRSRVAAARACSSLLLVAPWLHRCQWPASV